MNIPAHITHDPSPGLQPAKEDAQDGMHIATAVFADAAIVALEARDAVLTRGVDDGDDVGLVDLGDGVVGPALRQSASDYLGFNLGRIAIARPVQAENMGILKPAPRSAMPFGPVVANEFHGAGTEGQRDFLRRFG